MKFSLEACILEYYDNVSKPFGIYASLPSLIVALTADNSKYMRRFRLGPSDTFCGTLAASEQVTV